MSRQNQTKRSWHVDWSNFVAAVLTFSPRRYRTFFNDRLDYIRDYEDV